VRRLANPLSTVHSCFVFVVALHQSCIGGSLAALVGVVNLVMLGGGECDTTFTPRANSF
jgi:hypothetical protein